MQRLEEFVFGKIPENNKSNTYVWGGNGNENWYHDVYGTSFKIHSFYLSHFCSLMNSFLHGGRETLFIALHP